MKVLYGGMDYIVEENKAIDFVMLKLG